jgi:hypothetical protein
MSEGFRVLETGVALVHQDEHIVPAAGSEATLATETGDVHYHFPVHLLVVGGLEESVRAEIRDEVMDQLYRALG